MLSLGSVPVSSLALEPLVLLWQEPRASQRWITRSDRCLKSGTAHRSLLLPFEVLQPPGHLT